MQAELKKEKTRKTSFDQTDHGPIRAERAGRHFQYISGMEKFITCIGNSGLLLLLMLQWKKGNSEHVFKPCVAFLKLVKIRRLQDLIGFVILHDGVCSVCVCAHSLVYLFRV